MRACVDCLPPLRRTEFSILAGRRASDPAGSPGLRGHGGGSDSKGRRIDQRRLSWKLIVFVSAQSEALKFQAGSLLSARVFRVQLLQPVLCFRDSNKEATERYWKSAHAVVTRELLCRDGIQLQMGSRRCWTVTTSNQITSLMLIKIEVYFYFKQRQTVFSNLVLVSEQNLKVTI